MHLRYGMYTFHGLSTSILFSRPNRCSITSVLIVLRIVDSFKQFQYFHSAIKAFLAVLMHQYISSKAGQFENSYTARHE